MNILLISQCSKNALIETRRILDQFAERRGDRTWQTAITQQGLDTLHKMLRKTARKNTAVACHWIRGKDHSELMWVVGDAKCFNVHGATPTNTTTKDVLRSEDENDWHTAEDIRLLASLAALFHDFGKANKAFQEKLRSSQPLADAYRHEWVSLRLFEAFVRNCGNTDRDWLQRLAKIEHKGEQSWKEQLIKDGMTNRPQSPFKDLPPLAQIVGWLIVSHHRLPVKEFGEVFDSRDLKHLPVTIESQWCGVRSGAQIKEIEACWSFGSGVPFNSQHWCKHAGRVAQSMLLRPSLLAVHDLKNDPYILHLSRLALMLADHYYSSQPSHARYGDSEYPLYANTDRNSGALKQRLDEHLIGVEVNASRIVQTLPRMAQQLPRIARHKGFRQRSKDSRFRWQDRAFDLAESIQARSAQQGFFGVNMASTGCGKTLANGRIMYALADPQRGARFNIALGLRTLTLQTGDVYREKLGLGSEDLAVLVGGGAVRALHEHQRTEEAQLASKGSESSAALLFEHNYVHFEGSLEDGPLNRWLSTNQDAQRLLNAPILACTIDHLMPATEGIRGGHQIVPMLRLMSSDLVLDEPDDFGIEDLPALTRLVHWAGMLGSRVLLSSATLPPALVQGLFQAYLEGRRSFQRNRGMPGQSLNVWCAWFDEFESEASEHAEGSEYLQAHQAFVEKRLSKLAKSEVRRKAEIVALDIPSLPNTRDQKRQAISLELAKCLHEHLHNLHIKHHSVDPETHKRVSFGLIRMANIDPLFETAKALYTLGANGNSRIHLCVYHGQHPLLVRSGIERRLDRLLNRKDPQSVFKDEEIRQCLDRDAEHDQIFVVLATAVAEVGRDHDYDWGIVEPSSVRSIIQLAGRIRRHRPGLCEVPNLYLLDTNIRYLLHGAAYPVFCRPGFESSEFSLKYHRLTELLTSEQVGVIDASTRIRERKELQPQHNLVDLEHARLRALMLGAEASGIKTIPVSSWWNTPAMLSGELQRKQLFREDTRGRQRYGLLPDDEGKIHFYRFERDGKRTQVGNLKHDVKPEPGPRIGFWGEPDYAKALDDLAEALEIDALPCACRFGILDLPEKGMEQGWFYHPALGFSKFR